MFQKRRLFRTEKAAFLVHCFYVSTTKAPHLFPILIQIQNLLNNGKVFVAPVWWHLHAQNMLGQYQRGREMTTEAEKESFLTELRSQVGNTGDTITARDAVNQSTIRNWCDAVSESNPHYLNPETAEEGHTARLSPLPQCSKYGPCPD